MVKIPGLDDLRKMGSDLIDSAKTVNLSDVVDKLKTGMESVGIKKNTVDPLAGDDPLGKALQETRAVIDELAGVNGTQRNLISKLQNQLSEVMKIAALYQKPAVAPASTEETSHQSQDPNK